MYLIEEIPEDQPQEELTRTLKLSELDALLERARRNAATIAFEEGYSLGRHEAKFGPIEIFQFDNAACIICAVRDQAIGSDYCKQCGQSIGAARVLMVEPSREVSEAVSRFEESFA